MFSLKTATHRKDCLKRDCGGSFLENRRQAGLMTEIEESVVVGVATTRRFFKVDVAS